MNISKPEKFSDPLITHSIVGRSAISQLISKLGQLWKGWIDLLIERNDIKVEILRDKAGNTYWIVDDLLTGCRLYFYSETELRVWCDRRYYPTQHNPTQHNLTRYAVDYYSIRRV